MKKIFLILLTLPIFCFGKTTFASSGGIPAYAGVIICMLSVISILICVYLYLQLSSFRTKLDRLVLEEKLRKDSEDFKKQTGVLPQDSKIENELPQIDDSSKVKVDFVTKAFVENMFNRFDERIVALENLKPAEKLLGEISDPIETVEDRSNDTLTVPGQKIEQIGTVVSEPVEYICYAKLTGIEGGFQEEEFLSQQNGEQIYMLRLKENEGSFTISDNANAQRYALTDVKRYLTFGCEYLTLPDGNCEIITKTPGTVHKSGNQWLIIDKAVIEFV